MTAFWKAGFSMLTTDEEKGVSVFSGNVDFTAQIVKVLRRHSSLKVLDITLADHPELDEIVLNKSQRFGRLAFLVPQKLCY